MSLRRLFLLLAICSCCAYSPRGGAQGTGDSLLLHYTFDETSGSTAADATGNYDGTLGAGASFRPDDGYLGGALQLNGTDGRVSVPTFDIVGNELSITAYIYLDNLLPSTKSDEGRIISKSSTTAEADHYWMLSMRPTGQLRLRLRTGGVTTSFASPDHLVSTGQWFAVAATYDGATVRLFVNREQVLAVPHTGTLDSDASVPIAVGNQAAPAAPTRPLAGRVDELKVFDRALTAAQLPAFDRETYLSHWNFDEPGGTIAADGRGRHDGTLQGGAAFAPNDGYALGAVTFDGTDGRVLLPAFDLVGEAMTVTAWINVADLSDTNNRDEGRIISKARGAGRLDHYWMLGLLGDRIRMRLRTTGSAIELDTPSGFITTDTWIYVSFTYDGTTARIYIDGTEVQSAPLTGRILTDANMAVSIGNQPPGQGARPLSGRIDDLQLYQRALSPQEINAAMGGADLPVTWQSVSVRPLPTTTGATLRWAIGEQRHNRGFYVERSGPTGTGFGTLQFIPATEGLSYRYVDRDLGAGSYLYRLRQVDFDGTQSYSPIVELRLQPSVANLAYPNPAGDYLAIERYGRYRILTTEGRVAISGHHRAGSTIPLTGLAAGTYYLSIGGLTVPFVRQ